MTTPAVKSYTVDELGNLLLTLADKRGTQLQVYPEEIGLYDFGSNVQCKPVLCSGVVLEPCGSREIVQVVAVKAHAMSVGYDAVREGQKVVCR